MDESGTYKGWRLVSAFIIDVRGFEGAVIYGVKET